MKRNVVKVTVGGQSGAVRQWDEAIHLQCHRLNAQYARKATNTKANDTKC